MKYFYYFFFCGEQAHLLYADLGLSPWFVVESSMPENCDVTFPSTYLTAFCGNMTIYEFSIVMKKASLV